MSSIPICSICCEKFTSSCVVQTTKCGHLFHGNCIRRWVNRSSTCPECRQSSGLLHRIYLHFDDVEETTSLLSTTKTTQKEVEILVLRLSLEEAKRKAAEKSVQENANKEHQQAEMAKKNEREHQKLRISYRELKLSLEEERRQRRAAEEAKESFRKELNALKQVSSKKSTQTIAVTNARRKETTNVTVKIKPSACSHHSAASSSRLLVPSSSLLTYKLRNGMQDSPDDDLESENFLLHYHFYN